MKSEIKKLIVFFALFLPSTIAFADATVDPKRLLAQGEVRLKSYVRNALEQERLTNTEIVKLLDGLRIQHTSPEFTGGVCTVTSTKLYYRKPGAHCELRSSTQSIDGNCTRSQDEKLEQVWIECAQNSNPLQQRSIQIIRK